MNEDKIKKDLEEIETIDIELDHRVSKLIAENEHLKQTYKQLYDSIKPTRIRSKEQCDDLINQVNLKSVEISDLNASLQEKVLEITALKDDLRKLKGKALVDNAVTKHTIDPEKLKIDVEPITPKLLNKRTTKLIEHVKSKYPLDHSLESACRYAKLIQELLTHISKTCPSVNNTDGKIVAVTPKNKDKRVRFTEPVTSSGNTITKTTSTSNLVSNKPMLSSTGVKPSTSASGSQPSGNTKKDKIRQTPSSTQKNKVEAHPRKVKSSLKNKDCVVQPKGTAHVQHSKLNANSELKCVKCNGCMLSDNHDLCVLDFINNVNARKKSKSVNKSSKRKVWKPTGKVIATTTEVPLRKLTALENETPNPVVTLVYSRKPKKSKTNSKSEVLKSVSANKKEPSPSWGSIVSDVPSSSLAECRLSKLFSVKFGNDHVVKILGYGDYQIRNVTISRVYYVKGLGYNLFSVGQFCDLNLEVAFRQHTCFIRNLEGVDLLTGSRGNNLYTVSLGDMMASSPICLLSKASKTKSKDEAPDFIIKFLKVIQVRLKVPVQRIRTDNRTEFVNQTLREYYEKVGISHETYVARSPHQNGVLERHNCKLIEAARTILIYIKASLFLWAEAVATACYTQNRSIVRLRHEKTPYELLHDKPPDLSFFHVFGALCYPTNDSDNLGKLQPKADIGIFIGYAATKKAFRIFNRHTRRIIETIHVDFDELTAMASERSSSGPTLHEMTPATISSGLVPNPPPSTPFVPPSRSDWDILFQPLFDELLTPPPSVDNPAPEVIAPIAEVIFPTVSVSLPLPRFLLLEDFPLLIEDKRYGLGLILYRTPYAIKGVLRNELEELKKEKDSIDFKIKKFENSAKDLDCLLGTQRSVKDKTGLPEFVDDTVTDYSRPTPSIDVSKDVSDEQKAIWKSNSASFSEQGGSVGNVVSKPMIRFVKETGCPSVSKVNNTEKSRKPTVKYAEMYSSVAKTKDKEERQRISRVEGIRSKFGNNKWYQSFYYSECLVLGKDFKVDDSHVLLRTPRQHNMYSIDLNNIVPHKNLTCLIAKASVDESMMWHRRLGHLNFKTINKLVRNNLVRGLPSKSFENDHSCVACLKGKQHKASCKNKLVNLVSKPFHTLHMDLFGPTSLSGLNHKWYCLVVTDDFSRFTWTFFLKSKDETGSILRNLITEIENLKDLKVKIIRCDNGGEFKNRDMDDFCTKKGIKREFSNARTPQQNGVAERRNKTLIEAARTMLADAKLPVTFWAEAVSTACYV
ncbi:retrovirus-related pol polyprotein from transposon TNT 1-94 [Tanacetum coccineum]